jgi:hypothetical protein
MRDMHEDQLLFTGILVGDDGTDTASFDQANVAAHGKGARGMTFFTVQSLNDEHRAIKKYHERTNP